MWIATNTILIAADSGARIPPCDWPRYAGLPLRATNGKCEALRAKKQLIFF